MVDENQTGMCTIIFLPKKVFGQWMARKATIVADRKSYTTKFGKKVEFQLNGGTKTLYMYANYLGETCQLKVAHNFETGKKYLVRYRTPLLVFMNGKAKIEEVPS
jgi:hypothetical protein